MTHNVFVLKQKIKKKPINLPLIEYKQNNHLKRYYRIFFILYFFYRVILKQFKN